MTEYSEIILKYVNDSKRTGCIDQADGTGETGLASAEIGKRLAVRFTLKTRKNSIEQVRFQVFGCGFTIAACAAAAEQCEGKTLQQAQTLTELDIHQLLQFSLPAERNYCAQLALTALQAAVSSAQKSARPVTTELQTATEHDEVRITQDDLLYQAFLASLSPSMNVDDHEDQRMFASLLSVASQDSSPLNLALGLAASEVDWILETYFPEFDRAILEQKSAGNFTPLPEINPDIYALLLTYISRDTSLLQQQKAELLAKMISARAAYSGHLWISMGFFKRPQLTAAIQRHLPKLAVANQDNMRWKRFLFKQVCDLNGGTLCKTPNCSDCSDFALCFAAAEE